MNKEQMEYLLSKELLTVPEVRAMLGLSNVTVTRMIGINLEGVDLSTSDKKANWRIRSRSVRKLLGMDEVVTA